jgi:hypothetical protein
MNPPSRSLGRGAGAVGLGFLAVMVLSLCMDHVLHVLEVSRDERNFVRKVGKDTLRELMSSGVHSRLARRAKWWRRLARRSSGSYAFVG